jgi:hypothetical protein
MLILLEKTLNDCLLELRAAAKLFPHSMHYAAHVPEMLWATRLIQ